jgi:hypothetical protein
MNRRIRQDRITPYMKKNRLPIGLFDVIELRWIHWTAQHQTAALALQAAAMAVTVLAILATAVSMLVVFAD